MTEAEYIALSMALCDVIPLMELIKEMRDCKFDILHMQSYVYCKVFEDNSSALEQARLPKTPPTYQAHQCMLPSIQRTCSEELN